mmetsp:Transcript_60687/g.198660  ORF Transcript_60687/g.198660 Transcript_60687/m.198660 type:complete len:341 (+) Transcript_60687:42-1064(+)
MSADGVPLLGGQTLRRRSSGLATPAAGDGPRGGGARGGAQPERGGRDELGGAQEPSTRSVRFWEDFGGVKDNAGADARRRSSWAPLGSASLTLFGEVVRQSRDRGRLALALLVYVAMAIVRNVLLITLARIGVDLGTSLERGDAAFFSSSLTSHVTMVAMLFLARLFGTLAQLAWQLLLQRLVTFGTVGALFSASAFYHLQFSDVAQTPEQLICEESHRFLQQVSFSLDLALGSALGTIGCLVLILDYGWDLALVALLSLPLQAPVMRCAQRVLNPLVHREVLLRQELQFSLTRVQDAAEQIALFRGSASELSRWESILGLVRCCLALYQSLRPWATSGR